MNDTSIVSQISRINGNIASAYVACAEKGAVIPELRNSNNLPSTIQSISAKENTLILYDYDGSIVSTYTRAEALELTALPAQPIHSGLIPQGWAWTLEQIKSTVRAGNDATVGGYYRTDDDTTRLYIRLEAGQTEFYFRLYQPTRYDNDHIPIGVTRYTTIDWGDGSAPYTTDLVSHTDSDGTAYLASHTYSPSSYPAEYVVALSVADKEDTIRLGALFPSNSEDLPVRRALYKAELSRYTQLSDSVFTGAECMREITVPGPTYFGHDCFSGCASLISAVCGVSPQRYTFYHCYDLRYVCLPPTQSTVGYNCFDHCRQLRRVGGMEYLTSIGYYAFAECGKLEHISLASAVNIDYLAFENCIGLSEPVVLPPSLETVAASVFYGCEFIPSIKLELSCSVPYLKTSIVSSGSGSSYYQLCYLEEYDLTYYTSASQIPPLPAAFENTFIIKNYRKAKVRFLVASETMKTAFMNATNWADGAEYYIVKESPDDQN